MLIALLVIVLVMVIAAAVVFFRYVMRRYVIGVSAHLQNLNQEYLKKQEELKQRSMEGDRHYQEQVGMVKAEIDRMRAQAIEEAETIRQQLVAQGREENERLIQKAIESQEVLKRELEQGLEARVLVRACELVQEVLPQELRQAVQLQWLDELIDDGLATIERPPTHEQVCEARVVSAFPLTPDQRRRLSQRLEATLGGAVTVKESVDPRLIAGLTITLGHLVFDGSLASKLQQATRHVQRAAQ